MLARVAENIYWLSRYLERAENTVRLVDVHSRMLLDFPDADDHTAWSPLITISALEEQFDKKYDSASEANVCDFLLADKENPGSVLNAFGAIQNNLRSCRDIVPRSSYEAINGACRFVRQQVGDANADPSHRQAFLSSTKTRLLAIFGDMASNMSHDIGYRFMRMGCDIERADMTSRIIDVQSTRLAMSINDTFENIALQQQRWISVLRSLSALQMYRQQVRRPVNGRDTLHFLLLDRNLPRSYTYCLKHLDSTLKTLNNNEKPRLAIKNLRRTLSRAQLKQLSKQPLQLHQFIDDMQTDLQDVASVIADTYFLPHQDL